MLDLFEEFKALISTLSERNISYALCGGLAMAVYGVQRATVDIDLLIETEDLEKASATARSMGYTIEAQPMTCSGGAIEIRLLSKLAPGAEDVLMLDMLLVTPQIQKVWESREEIEWEGGRLWVVSRAGLIALKSLRRSNQDIDDIKRLQEGNYES